MLGRTSTEIALNPQTEASRTADSDAAIDAWALVMWTFDTYDGADDAIDTLVNGRRAEARVSAAAVAQWPQSASRPATRAIPELSEGVLSDIFWSTFFGLVFFLPLVSAALGAVERRADTVLSGAGIDDEFVNQARDQLIPCTSALFLLTPARELYGVVDAAAAHRPELVVQSLNAGQERKLETAFGPST